MYVPMACLKKDAVLPNVKYNMQTKADSSTSTLTSVYSCVFMVPSRGRIRDL